MTYKCEYCGFEYDGEECPQCGAPHPVTTTTNNKITGNNNYSKNNDTTGNSNYSTNNDTIGNNNYSTNNDTAGNYRYSTDNESIDTNTDDNSTTYNYTTNYYTINSHAADNYTSDNSYRTDSSALNTNKHKKRKRLTETRGFIVFLLIIFFPAGLFLMWTNKVFKFSTRTIITLFYVLMIYLGAKLNEMPEVTDTTASGNEKTVEVAAENTPTPISNPTPTLTSTPSPAPTKKPVSKKEKFIKKVSAKTGITQKTAGNLYDLFYKKMGFKTIDIVQKSKTGKATYDFKADGFNLKVAFKDGGVSSIKWQFYTLYAGKVIKIDKQGVLDRQLVDSVKYYMYAEDIIEDNIKTPSTARFPDMDSSGVGMQRKGKIVAVQGYFDAQNTYGAVVRSKYTVEFSVTDLDANKYKPVYIKIDDEVKGKWIELD